MSVELRRGSGAALSQASMADIDACAPGPHRLALSPAWQLMRMLLGDVDKGRRLFGLAILLSACASGASVALMGVAGWLLSRAAEMPPVLYLEAAAVGVRFFGISRGVFRYAERLVGHDLALRMQSALRMRVYGRLSGTTLLGRRHGDLLVRVTADVEAVLDLVVRVVVPACSAALVIVGTTVLLGRFSVGSAAVLLGSAVLAGVVMPWLTRRISLNADRVVTPLRGELADRTRELAVAAPDLVALGAEEGELQRVLDVDARLRDAERRAARVRGLATGGQVLAAGVAVIGALVIGGRAVADGTMGGRILAVLVLTPLALHEVFASFTSSAQTFTRATGALNRVVEVLDAPLVGSGDSTKAHVDGVHVRAEDPPSLHIEDLAIGWPGHDPVLTGLDLDIAPGERVAVVGPSGVGKTTLAATVMGLIPAVSGSVDTTGRVRYLAQDAHVFASTIAENVKIGDRDATDREIAEALAHAGLEMPLDRLIGEDGATLSGGEAQRLAMARVLVHHAPELPPAAVTPSPTESARPELSVDPQQPPLLILDEPTEHLDSETSSLLMDDLWASTLGAAMLVITHDRDVMDRCDRVWRIG